MYLNYGSIVAYIEKQHEKKVVFLLYSNDPRKLKACT